MVRRINKHKHKYGPHYFPRVLRFFCRIYLRPNLSRLPLLYCWQDDRQLGYNCYSWRHIALYIPPVMFSIRSRSLTSSVQWLASRGYKI